MNKKPTKHTCGNCCWAKFQLTKTGRVKRGLSGWCVYRITWPKMPLCEIEQHWGRRAIWPDSCNDCPCWEAIRCPADELNQNQKTTA